MVKMLNTAQDASVIGYCAHCKQEIYATDYIYDGEAVCRECYEYASADEAVLSFIKSYPKRFFEYLEESLVSDYEIVQAVLKDYREWNEEEYKEWIKS